MKNMMTIGMVSGLLLAFAVNVTAQTTEDWEQKEREWKQKAIDAYVFPIRPGMAEWAKFKTHAEMIAACQIPDHILKNISTPGLVETYLNYPLIGDMLVYNSYLQGLEQIISSFNGLQELLKRDDAGMSLLERYKIMDPQREYQKWKERTTLTPYFVSFPGIELLLSYDLVLSKIPQHSYISLLQESLRVFRSMQQSDYYSLHGTTAFLMAKFLESVSYQPLQQRIVAIPQKDSETLRQEILQKRPDLKHTNFTPIPRSGEEIYRQDLLRTGGMFSSKDIIDAIVLSVEQYLSEKE